VDYYSPHPTLQLERPLALVGFMGSGVRGVAHGIASRTGLPLHDLQRWVENDAGMSWARLLLEQGPQALAEAERRGLDRALREAQSGVIALSHGALLDTGIRAEALSRTQLIYLERPIEVLFERIVSQLRERPASIAEFMLGPPRNVSDLRPYFEEREPGYRQAPVSIGARDLHDGDIVETLLAELRARD
jgi:shikimate kinase